MRLSETPELRPGETGDAALGGAVHVIQPGKGYRFSVDAVLLARFASEEAVGQALDLGCGCGVVALCLLALGGARSVMGVDLQPDMVDRAARSAAWNGWAARARFLVADIRDLEGVLGAGRFDLVVANPPYRPVGAGRVSPDPSTAVARHEVACGIGDVVRTARERLAPGGRLCVVYPAARLATLLWACRSEGIEPRVLRPVHPREGAPASRVLLRAEKGGREGLELRAPLVLHAPGRRYSPEADRLLGPP